MPYRVGFDVGGTFTDFVLQSPAGELLAAKRLTTYPDPSEACLAGLDELIARSGVPWSDVAQAIHGTTLGSNIVIERKARGVGLLTTRGFRDVLVIGREKRYQVYDLQIEKPAPLIPRRLTGEVTERILADGTVRTPLDEADARRAIRELAARGTTTLAICLLHSYLNPAHERRLAALVAEEAPDVTVTLSHEVSPTFREYERPSTTTAFELHRVNNAPGSGLPMNIQAIDLVEIGAGGGSIADARLGVITVGPESASSVPGPVCYGRGGVAPTVTDADLVLGYINPGYFAGGSITLEPGAAARAIEERVARPLGLSLEDAAWGIHMIVNTNMELATRVVSIERGRDPRDLTLVAFGGSGPVHGCRLAHALGIPRVILPAAAGVTAAIGLLAAEVRFDVARTSVRRLDAADSTFVDAMYSEMAAQAIEVVRESAVAGEVTVVRSADARYVRQGYEVTVPVPPGRLDAAALARVRASFDDIYAARYGYANQGEPVEIVTWKLSALGGSPRIALAKAAGRSGDGRRKCVRRGHFPEARGHPHTPRDGRDAAAPGMWPTGPAGVEGRGSTA